MTTTWIVRYADVTPDTLEVGWEFTPEGECYTWTQGPHLTDYDARSGTAASYSDGLREVIHELLDLAPAAYRRVRVVQVNVTEAGAMSFYAGTCTPVREAIDNLTVSLSE